MANGGVCSVEEWCGSRHGNIDGAGGLASGVREDCEVNGCEIQGPQVHGQVFQSPTDPVLNSAPPFVS